MWKLLVPFCLLIALTGASILSDKPLPRADVVFVQRGEPRSLDIAQMSWVQDFRIGRLIYQGLTQHDVFSRSFRVVPAIARSWDVSPDARTYTFHLRPDARWSNGQPVTAHDFAFSWRRMLLPDGGKDYTKLFTLLEGGQAFFEWRLAALDAFAADQTLEGEPRRLAAEALWRETLDRFASTVGVRALDDHTLAVTLERPTPYFLDLTAFSPFYPVYPPLVEQNESIDPRTAGVKPATGWTRPPSLVTNGPFMITRWRFKRDMRFEQNPYYWDRSSLGVRTIEVPSIDDTNAQVLAFRTGAIDWIADVSAGYRGEMVAQKRAFFDEHAGEVLRLRAEGLDDVAITRRLPPDPRGDVHVFPHFGTYFYNFNCMPRLRDGRENPFADPRVRRAFSLAVDREAVVRNITRSGERPATTLIPPGAMDGYASPAGLGFDPARARRELADAGFPGGQGLPAVELLFNKDSGHDLIAQAIAKDWQQHLGASVVLQTKEALVFREDLRNANYMVSRASWFGDYGDPTTFLELNRTGDGNNDRKYASPAYDALLDQAARTQDPRTRLDLLTRAERLIVEEDVPLLPIYHYVQVVLFDARRVSGVTPHARQIQNAFLLDILGDGLGPDVPMEMHGP